MDKDTALKLALEELLEEYDMVNSSFAKCIDEIFKQARAAPVQEPVAWMVYTQDGKSVYVTDNPTDIQEGQRALPLYTTPPAAQPAPVLIGNTVFPSKAQLAEFFSKPPAQRQWIGLSHEEVMDSWDEIRDGDWAPDFYAVIEAKLRSKNT